MTMLRRTCHLGSEHRAGAEPACSRKQRRGLRIREGMMILITVASRLEFLSSTLRKQDRGTEQGVEMSQAVRACSPLPDPLVESPNCLDLVQVPSGGRAVCTLTVALEVMSMTCRPLPQRVPRPCPSTGQLGLNSGMVEWLYGPRNSPVSRKARREGGLGSTEGPSSTRPADPPCSDKAGNKGCRRVSSCLLVN